MAVTLIAAFAMPADLEESFLATWIETSAKAALAPGYIDATLHRATDPEARFRFVNVAHWETAEAYRAAFKDAPRPDSFQQIEAFPALYEVVATR